MTIVKLIIRLCKGSRMIRYYDSLNGKNAEGDVAERERKINESQASMCVYYRELDLMKKAEIYSSMLYDYYRITLTRWRLSNHNLKIETGRYTRPYTERKDRICTMCSSIEDEHHVVFSCPRYDDVRANHTQLLEQSSTIMEILNPRYNLLKDTANFLRAIENKRDELNLE